MQEKKKRRRKLMTNQSFSMGLDFERIIYEPAMKLVESDPGFRNIIEKDRMINKQGANLKLKNKKNRLISKKIRFMIKEYWEEARRREDNNEKTKNSDIQKNSDSS